MNSKFFYLEQSGTLAKWTQYGSSITYLSYSLSGTNIFLYKKKVGIPSYDGLKTIEIMY